MRKVFLLILLSAVALSAQKFQYPQSNPKLEITFPESWHTVHYEQFIESRSVEDSLQFVLMSFGTGHDIESAKSFLLSFLEEMASDLQMEKGETFIINEILFYSFTGKGKISEQSKFIVTAYIFYLSESDYYGVITIYPRENKDYVEGEVKKVLNSVSKL